MLEPLVWSRGVSARIPARCAPSVFGECLTQEDSLENVTLGLNSIFKRDVVTEALKSLKGF